MKVDGLAAALFLGGVIVLASPQSGNHAAGIYTTVQAKRGEAGYDKHCKECHNGGFGPSLKGEDFWSQWDQKMARPLYSTIISTMPQDDPGSLPEKDVLDIVAYILQMNGLPEGDKEIESAKELNTIKLERPK